MKAIKIELVLDYPTEQAFLKSFLWKLFDRIILHDRTISYTITEQEVAL